MSATNIQQPRVVRTSTAPTFEVGQLVLVSIPGLGYQDTLAQVVGIDMPIQGSSAIIILADKRFASIFERRLPNRELRLAKHEEIVAELSALRRRFRMWMPSAKRLIAIGNGWGFRQN